MNLAFLKKVRVIVSLIFFLFSGFLFIDAAHQFQTLLAAPVLYMQFVPSLLKFISVVAISSAGFIFVLILTSLFGRVYCSFICPLGVLQDIITYLSKITRKIFKLKRQKYRFAKPYNFFRYSLLGITAASILSGSAVILNLLDPYSMFGKIFQVFFRHFAVQFHDTMSWIFESFGLFILYPIDLKPYNYALLGFVIFMSLLIISFSIRYGRLYCNTLCPVGSLLGLISKYSIFKIKFDEESCTNCGLCQRVCKSECIDYENRYIDESRCVGCFNCFESCPENGFKYKFSLLKSETKTDLNKRTFIFRTTLASTAMAISSCQKMTGHDSNKYYQRPKSATPPGSISLQNYTSKCTACQLCVAVCPTQVLQPSLTEFGLTGIFQPAMDYPFSFCNYECTSCTDVCPTGAIRKLNVEQKKLTQIGTAKLIKDLCVVFVNKKDCGACSEQCPTKAVFMIPYEKNLSAPEINNEICVGCGACEHACPTKPIKAIYVKANEFHKPSKKPKSKKLEQPIPQEDFPF